jgi:hypothetical protein
MHHVSCLSSTPHACACGQTQQSQDERINILRTETHLTVNLKLFEVHASRT